MRNGLRRGQKRAIVSPMSRRWNTPTLPPEELPLVVLWKEMLAATGIPEFRAWQLVQEGGFPIPHLPYFGYHPRRARQFGRSEIDASLLCFSKIEVWKFIVLDERERTRQTALDFEKPRCCHCPFHRPPEGQSYQPPSSYANRFRRPWWAAR